jgi:hypothetical protein
VTSKAFSGSESIIDKATSDSILDVYEAVSQLDHLCDANIDTRTIDTEIARMLASARRADFSTFADKEPPSTDNLNIVKACCELSCLVFWRLLKIRSQFDTEILAYLTKDITWLLGLLMQIRAEFWIQAGLEVFVWIMFTGIAGCVDAKDRERLLNSATAIITAVESDDLTLMTQGWKYFNLLRSSSGLNTRSHFHIILESANY